MQYPVIILPFALFTLALLEPVMSARAKPERVLLSNVKSLTLRKDLMTTANRVSAIPQMKCIGGSAKGLYDVDVLRCKNAGSGYDDSDVQWTCTASLPSEFKLGGTDVICEGFSNPTDPYVLKGSCGVEYRLMLTEAGEQRYGGQSQGGSGENWWDWQGDSQRSKSGDMGAILFWVLFVGVVGWMLWSAFVREGGAARRPRATRDGGAYGDGWGGGGGGDDPPPPYDGYGAPPSKPRTARAQPAYNQRQQQQQGWRPGFWTGTAAGAAGAYLAGRGTRAQTQEQPRQQTQSRSWGNANGNGEGSSSGLTSGHGSSRHESSGFGSTSRR